MAKEILTKTLISVIGMGLVILAWGIAFGAIKSDVEHIGNQSTENKNSIKVIEVKVGKTNEALIRIDTRQEVLIETVQRIDGKLK